ncbi:MAG: hypothetical protein ISR65_19190 [Bacteriovoracaceae bacterium]|nr:hypothetical protein [Bacteriovoracaceae bacterium]
MIFIDHFKWLSIFNGCYAIGEKFRVSVGFSPNPYILFHAPGGLAPVRSEDGGKTWSDITIDLDSNEYIKYWATDTYNENKVFCGTTAGLFYSNNKGLTWLRHGDFSGESHGTYIDYRSDGPHIVYHATSERIWRSVDAGATFSSFYVPAGESIRGLAGGRDQNGLTLAFLDDNGTQACSWANDFSEHWSEEQLAINFSTCGYIWIGDDTGNFTRTNKEGGDHIRMAENDSRTIYVTGGRYWIRQYGTKIWKSVDRGGSWELKLFQLSWDVTPYRPWDSDKLEYSAPAVEQGWWDDGYESFTIHKRNPNYIGGTGEFFLHTSYDGGDTWMAPFTKFADVGERVKGKRWESVGLEVTTAYRFKFHPNNPSVGYVAMADIGGIVTEDGGNTFRISQAYNNSNFDYAFNPDNDQEVYTVSGSHHDFPEGWHAGQIKGQGGVFYSSDRGHNWTRITPDNADFNRQFISLAHDPINNFFYAGTQSIGVARSLDGGETWSYFNNGLPSGDKIVSQIEVDPENGDVYIMITGDYPNFTNRTKTGLYYLDVENGATSWELLRGTVHHPPEVDPQYDMWYYPIAFAVDFTPGSDRSTIWVADYENNFNWLASGLWKSTDRGQNWVRSIQYTHPTAIVMDPEDPDKVYANGRWQILGTWGDGGMLYTTDGGDTWKKNDKVPLQHNGYNVTLDPSDPTKIYYTFFGNALMHGPRPE